MHATTRLARCTSLTTPHAAPPLAGTLTVASPPARTGAIRVVTPATPLVFQSRELGSTTGHLLPARIR